MSEAIEILEPQGATIVDPADIPSVVDSDPGNNLVLWGICAGANQAKGLDRVCSVVLKFGSSATSISGSRAWVRAARWAR